MLRHLRSNLIAYVALFLALSGGSFAVAALNRHDKRVIKKIVNKQITRRAPGLSVNHANSANEATHAASATSATSADAVGGETVKKFFMKGPANTPETEILHLDGLSISAGCDGTAKP